MRVVTDAAVNKLSGERTALALAYEPPSGFDLHLGERSYGINGIVPQTKTRRLQLFTGPPLCTPV